MKNSILLRKCATYSAIQQTMRDYQTAYLGGLAFKNGVRKKRPSEDEKLHYDVVANTSAMPVSRYVVDTINDTVFSQQIDRDLEFAYPNGLEVEDEALTEWTELVMYDADLNNRSMNQVMEHIGELTSIFGHCWVFVDMPSTEQGNAYRPYVCPVSPLSVWDWQFTTVNGRYIPSYIKVCEYEDTYQYHIKTYFLGTKTEPSRWEFYKIDKLAHAEADTLPIDTGTFPPGMSIPGFIAFTRRDTRFHDLGVSDIDFASDVQREVYKLETEAYQSIQFAKTIVRAAPNVKVPAYAGAIVRGMKDDIETLSIDTTDVDRIISKQENLLLNLENLTGLGGLRTNKTQSQSGISIIEERRSLHKVASAKAREMEIAEEKIWTFMARYMDLRWAGNIEYKTDYEESDIKMKIAKLDVAQRLAGDNPVIKGIIQREVLELLVDSDEVDFYANKMVALDPNTIKYEEPEEEMEVETNDLGDQTPERMDAGEKDIIEGKTTVSSMTETDVGITYTGISSYDPVADQLVARASGR
jgi:hypothetical protein